MKYLGKERPCKECDDTKKPEGNLDCPNAWFYKKCLLELAELLDTGKVYEYECGVNGKELYSLRKLAKQARISAGVK